jgi:stage II sporulation protein D
MMFTWRRIASSLVFVVASSLALGQNVRIGVFGLFHPSELTIGVPTGSAIVIHAGERSFVLEKSSGVGQAHVLLSGTNMLLDVAGTTVKSGTLTITGRDGSEADFLLAIPGKITRTYYGTAAAKISRGSLVPVVSMDIETAVASVVAAESEPDAPLEAMKAQAVAARSYLVAAKGRHLDFDFCDTTHCQFLRNPPGQRTDAARAVAATRGIVIVYNSATVPAMYTRSCSGRTHTPGDVGLPEATYSYYSVDCKHCRQHPFSWKSEISRENASRLRASDESVRLDVDRLMGWNIVPSSSFTMENVGDHVVLRGSGQGHGIGLCQSGAAAMAREGATFRQILTHYYPNTSFANVGANLRTLDTDRAENTR